MKFQQINEATVDDIRNRIPVFLRKYFKDLDQEKSLEIITQLIALDPTRGKYSEWIVRQYKLNNIRIPEDNEKIKQLLLDFIKKSNKLENKDISSYSPGQLARVLDQFDDAGSKREIKKAGRAGKLVLPSGATLVLTSSELQFVQIDTPEASSILCSGTKWCVANEEIANSYLADGPLFLIYKDNTRHVLLHLETDQCMDIYDAKVPDREKWAYIKLLEPVIGKIEDDPSMSCRYAIEVVGGRWIPGEKIIKTDPEFAYRYALDVIKGRWPDGESIIATRPWSASKYARDVIEGRWPEGEPAIMTNIAEAINYARDVIEGRWPEIEDRVSRDAEFACNYAKSVIKGRWPEVEDIIGSSGSASLIYALNVIKGRWPKGENAISGDSSTAYQYARYVIKGRWPEGEPAIMGNHELAGLYKNAIANGFKDF